MKAKILLVSAFILGTLLIMSGCEAQPANDNSQNTTVVTANIESGTSDGTTELPKSTVSEANMAAFTAAASLKDASFCEKISDADLKKKCVTNVADLSIQSDAISLNDPALCQKISITDLQQACKINVEAAAKFAERMTMPSTQEMKILRDAIDSGDVKQCELVKNPDQRNACKYNILNNKSQE